MCGALSRSCYLGLECLELAGVRTLGRPTSVGLGMLRFGAHVTAVQHFFTGLLGPSRSACFSHGAAPIAWFSSEAVASWLWPSGSVAELLVRL